MTLNIVNFTLDYNVSQYSIAVVNVCCDYWRAIDWIFVLLAEASGCHRYFAHMDCLTVDEMEKFMVYDSGADCRELICFYFFFFFSYYV